MTVAGPNSPAAGTDVTNVTGVGDQAWANTGNAFSANNTYATFTESSSGSNYLKAVNFGFSIPSGATIDGITVEIERFANLSAGGGSGGRITDVNVKLVKGGTISGTNKASATRWTTSEAYFTYGGAADLWGLAWTDSDINASTFGVALSVVGNRADGTEIGSVDHIRITVNYTGGVDPSNPRVIGLVVGNENPSVPASGNIWLLRPPYAFRRFDTRIGKPAFSTQAKAGGVTRRTAGRRDFLSEFAPAGIRIAGRRKRTAVSSHGRRAD